MRVCRGGRSVAPTFPWPPASKRTVGPAFMWRALRQLEPDSRFPRKRHQNTCRLGRGLFPGEHLPRPRCLNETDGG